MHHLPGPGGGPIIGLRRWNPCFSSEFASETSDVPRAKGVGILARWRHCSETNFLCSAGWPPSGMSMWPGLRSNDRQIEEANCPEARLRRVWPGRIASHALCKAVECCKILLRSVSAWSRRTCHMHGRPGRGRSRRYRRGIMDLLFAVPVAFSKPTACSAMTGRLESSE